MAARVNVRRGGELVMSPSKRRQTRNDGGSQPIHPEETMHEIEGRIKKLHLNVMVSSYQIGGLLVKLRDEHVPAGKWRNYLSGAQEKFGFSERTGYRYVDQYEEAVKLPSSKVKALENKGLDPAAPKVLAAIQNVLGTEGRLRPENFADAIQDQLKEMMTRQGGDIEPIDDGDSYRKQRRQTRLYEFASKLYQGVDPPMIQKEFNSVRDRIIKESAPTVSAKARRAMAAAEFGRGVRAAAA